MAIFGPSKWPKLISRKIWVGKNPEISKNSKLGCPGLYIKNTSNHFQLVGCFYLKRAFGFLATVRRELFLGFHCPSADGTLVRPRRSAHMRVEFSVILFHMGKHFITWNVEKYVLNDIMVDVLSNNKNWISFKTEDSLWIHTGSTTIECTK